MDEHNFTDDKMKMIPVIRAFAPFLEKEIRKWDGKVLNKKFYVAIEAFTKDWFSKKGISTTDDNLTIFVSYNNFVCNSRSAELTLIYNRFSFSFVYTTDVTNWQRLEENKAPRVNADALIENLHNHMKMAEDDYKEVKRTLSHEEEIRKMYALIAEVSQKFTEGKYDKDTLRDKFGLSKSVLQAIDNISFYTEP